MDTKENAIRYFTSLKGKKKILNTVEYEESLITLKDEADIGLEEEEVEALIDALVHIKSLGSNKFIAIMRCIVPRQKVAADSTLKLLQWIFTYKGRVPSGSIAVALEWIIGLVEFGLTDENSVHAFYHHLFLLLRDSKLVARFASKLIHMLTKPSDVYRWVVKKVLQIEEKYGKHSHTTALLGLFKSYKPECVPESIPAINLHYAFRHVGKMNPYFQQAQQRLGIEDRGSVKRKIVWNTTGGMKRLRTQRRTELIPPVDYIHFESERYKEVSLHSVLKFDSIISLGSHLHELDIPCNSMSLLQNEAGIHTIAFVDDTLQRRFSYCLYYTLHKVFIEQKLGYSYEEKDNLLNQIVALEEYMQQGIPVVSRFLAEYMYMWDCEDHRDKILKLLQWLYFTSYPELHELILDRINIMFFCGNIEVKSAVLATLRKFVQNLIMFGLYQRNRSATNVFLEHKGNQIDIETLECIIEFVSKLCEMGLIAEPGNYLLLNESLNFFEMMTFLEERHNLPTWTMTPASVLYSGMISRNAVMLSRVCSILLKYENVYPRLKEMKLRNKFTSHINLQKMFLIDFTNCLWNKKCFEKHTGYLFKDVPRTYQHGLSKYVRPNEALILTKHFAMLPYIAVMQKDSDILRSFIFDDEDLLIIIATCLEGIYNLIQLAEQN